MNDKTTFLWLIQFYKLWWKIFFKPIDQIYQIHSIDKCLKIQYTLDDKLFLLPPPNVTGSLHSGHLLNAIIQDIYYATACYDLSWIWWFFTMDHAGIATEKKVKDTLTNQQIWCTSILRMHIRNWLHDKWWLIRVQMRLFHTWCNTNIYRFTLDHTSSNLIRDIFIKLFDAKFIYWKMMPNVSFCAYCNTILSDAESIKKPKEKNKYLYRLRYYSTLDPHVSIDVDTTRPDSILFDVALAVHPQDKRYNWWIGTYFKVPFFKHHIILISDVWVKMNFGTGVLKITPFLSELDLKIVHDYNEDKLDVDRLPISYIYVNEWWTLVFKKSHHLSFHQIKSTILWMHDSKYLMNIYKLSINNTSFNVMEYRCYRCFNRIEKITIWQWFLRLSSFKNDQIFLKKIFKATKIKPIGWKKEFKEWILNLKDWCISRQLLLGHKIPAYVCIHEDCDRYYVGTQNHICSVHRCKMTPSKEVLDTWFSSSLAYFIFYMNASYQTEGLDDFITWFLKKRIFFLTTSYDILFFWVVRMIIMYNLVLKSIGRFDEYRSPFKCIFFHGLIWDWQHRKFSKSLNNAPNIWSLIWIHSIKKIKFFLLYFQKLSNDITWNFTDKMPLINRWYYTWNQLNVMIKHYFWSFEIEYFNNFKEEWCRISWFVSHHIWYYYHNLQRWFKNISVALEYVLYNSWLKSLYCFWIDDQGLFYWVYNDHNDDLEYGRSLKFFFISFNLKLDYLYRYIVLYIQQKQMFHDTFKYMIDELSIFIKYFLEYLTLLQWLNLIFASLPSILLIYLKMVGIIKIFLPTSDTVLIKQILHAIEKIFKRPLLNVRQKFFDLVYRNEMIVNHYTRYQLLFKERYHDVDNILMLDEFMIIILTLDRYIAFSIDDTNIYIYKDFFYTFDRNFIKQCNFKTFFFYLCIVYFRTPISLSIFWMIKYKVSFLLHLKLKANSIYTYCDVFKLILFMLELDKKMIVYVLDEDAIWMIETLLNKLINRYYLFKDNILLSKDFIKVCKEYKWLKTNMMHYITMFIIRIYQPNYACKSCKELLLILIKDHIDMNFKYRVGNCNLCIKWFGICMLKWFIIKYDRLFR